METFAQCFIDRGVTQRGQLGLFGRSLGNGLERAGDIGIGERVLHQGRRGVGLQGLPGGVIQLTGDLDLVGGLEAGHRAFLIGAALAIDLARRKMCAIQQHLRVQI